MSQTPPSPIPAPIRTDKVTSLKDIAKELDISYSLVSKVLSGKMGNTGVREELREKIIATAQRLNFRPNALASALKVGRKGAVGVMLHPVGEPGSGLITAFLRGVSAGLDEHGLRMWLRFFEFDAELLQHMNQRLRHDVDGLIVAGVPHPSTYEMINGLHLSGLPIVSMLESDFIPGVTNVTPNRKMQGELGARRLLEQGCKRIAYVFSPGMDVRHEGFLAVHAEFGVTPDPQLIYRANDFKLASGEAAVRHWFERGLTFDGVIAQSDPQAAGVINELLRRGVRVPEDVRVVGVDNSPLCDACSVTITSVTAEMLSAGRLAADMLARKLKGETVESVQIPPALVVRGSA